MQPVISETDFNELGQLLVKEKTPETKFLKDLLKRLKIVKDSALLLKTIRLNSIVILWNSLLKKIVKFRIVSPLKADLKSGNISVLSPIGLALIGRKENDDLILNAPGLEKRFKVIKVTNE